MNAAEPEWQKKFRALAGEKEDLEKLAATPIEKIDTEYRPDFEALQKQIKEYVDSGANYLLIQNYCMKFKPTLVVNVLI